VRLEEAEGLLNRAELRGAMPPNLRDRFRFDRRAPATSFDTDLLDVSYSRNAHPAHIATGRRVPALLDAEEMPARRRVYQYRAAGLLVTITTTQRRGRDTPCTSISGDWC
jgi:hypothetical protein